MDTNYFRSYFLNGIGKNIFAKSVTTYHVPEAILICPNKETTAVIRVITWLGLRLSLAILQDIWAFCRGAMLKNYLETCR